MDEDGFSDDFGDADGFAEDFGFSEDFGDADGFAEDLGFSDVFGDADGLCAAVLGDADGLCAGAAHAAVLNAITAASSAVARRCFFITVSLPFCPCYF